MEEERKYFAFISYNQADTRWGWRLQKKLERYKLPSTLCNARQLSRRPLQPIFFAPSEIQPGELSEELKARLRASKNLIVICSPYSAQSEWVGKEIRYFVEDLGRKDNIFFFIVDGTPNSGNSSSECFNPVIKQLKLDGHLGVNVHEKVYRWSWFNRERAYIQLVTKLLGIEFDVLWQRHRRHMLSMLLIRIGLLIFVFISLLVVARNSRPVNVAFQLKEISESNEHLPALCSAIFSLYLENEIKTDTICCLDKICEIKNIPHRYMGKAVRVTVRAKDYKSIDTTLSLYEKNTLNIARDPKVYGHIRFRLWSVSQERILPHVELSLEGMPLQSDENGFVLLDIPLPSQKTGYLLSSNHVNLIDKKIYVPCGEDDVILAE